MRSSRSRRSVPVTLPAPVGGLNGRDGLANMPATDAFVMDNWFPGSTTVDVRRGSANFATGMAGPVESIEVYTGGSSSKMLAFAGGSVYNATNGGVVGAAIASSRNSNKISSVMFSNAGNQYLLGLSGADAPFSYDGTTFTSLTITGLTGSQNTLHSIHSFKGRVYLAQVNQLGFYYLAVGAIQGAASYFDLAQQCKRGGYLVGISSFSQEGSGTGPNDYIVFMTSEGEYLMYAGTDPSSAANFTLVGRYYAGPPIGRKGWFNYRSDLYIICDEGVVSFTQIRQTGQDGGNLNYLTSKMGRVFTDLSENSGTYGWCAALYPHKAQLLVNVPLSSSTSAGYCQFVMNTNTGAWSRFKGMNGISWAVMDGLLYFGTLTGAVVLADTGDTDNGTQINCDVRQAYNYFDNPQARGASDKHFHFATFVMQSDGTPPVSAEINVNFQDDLPKDVGSIAAGVGATWDVDGWDEITWGSDGTTQSFTVAFGKLGYVASIWLRAVVTTAGLRWYATRLIMEPTKGIAL